MHELPDGIVTFLFTDVEGSTRAWEEFPDSRMAALRTHHDVIRAAVEDRDRLLIKPRGEGDSQVVVFRSENDVVACSAEARVSR